MDPGTIAVIGLALSAIGTGVSAYSAYEASEASGDAEAARKKQMNLDAQRRRREAIRQSIVARGMAVNTAAAQGASEGSAIEGAVAQVSGNAAESIVNTNQNVELGKQIYDANGRRIAAEGRGAIGQGTQGWGSMIMNNNVKISKLPSGLKGVWDSSEEVY